MDKLVKTSIWQQFGAAIDMLDNAIRVCPDELWTASLWKEPDDGPDYAQFWYLAYHVLFWLDLYLFGAVEGFAPPAPFTLAELDPTGLLPERIYSQDELRAYLNHCRLTCQKTIDELTSAKAGRRCKFGWGEVSYIELLLYNMRHVQEHAAQLNLLLGQHNIPVDRWVTKAK